MKPLPRKLTCPSCGRPQTVHPDLITLQCSKCSWRWTDYPDGSSYKKLPLATEYRVLLDILIMGHEADLAYVKKELKKLDKRKERDGI